MESLRLWPQSDVGRSISFMHPSFPAAVRRWDHRGFLFPSPYDFQVCGTEDMQVFLVLKLSLHHTLEQLFLLLILSLLTRLCWTSPKSHLMVYCLLLRKPVTVRSPPLHHLGSLHPRAGRPPPLLIQPLAIQTHAGPLARRRRRVKQLAAP